MITPSRSPFMTVRSAISPRLAYIRMLRAISEMAAAMTVWSPLENPASAASSRPFCRALTTSTSDVIGTSSSSATGYPAPHALEALPALPRARLFHRDDLVADQPLRFLDAPLQVADRGHFAQVDADGHQRLRDLGREAGNDHRRAQ